MIGEIVAQPPGMRPLPSAQAKGPSAEKPGAPEAFLTVWKEVDAGGAAAAVVRAAGQSAGERQQTPWAAMLRVEMTRRFLAAIRDGAEDAPTDVQAWRRLVPVTDPVEGPASKPCPPPSKSGDPAPADRYDTLIERACRTYGMDPLFVKAVIREESGFDPAATSPKGAQGLMQLMPATAAELGVRDPYDPGENILAGTRYLRQMLDRYEGNERLALAAYNCGMGRLERNPERLPAETTRYVERVLTSRGRMRA